MNETENVRRALDDLIGAAPVSLGRRGAVMSRIAKVSHRRRLATNVALGAFLAVVATYGGVQMITATPAGSTHELVEEDPTVAPSAEAPAKTGPTAAPGKAKPTAAPDKPKPSVVPGAPDAPKTTEEPKGDPTYEPKPPSGPKPTATKDEPVPGGLSVELWPYDTARAGAEMNWKVKAYDTSGRLVSVVVHFGDGTSKTYAPEEPCGADVNVKKFFPHTYAKAGTYAAKAVVTTGGCGAATETRTAYSSVKVLAADAVGNGAAKPTVSAEQVEAAAATLALHGADADGWVKKFYVDWGDGTETYAGPRPFDGCQDGKPSSWDTSASHDYAAPGTYTVTVTVLSTNCDAGEGQTSTFTLTVTV